MTYEKYNDYLAKLNGYIVTAIDGSDIILPSTEENAKKYGVDDPHKSVSPVMAKVSLMYDCINKIVLDTCIEPYKFSEQLCASQHIDQLQKNLRQPTITTFDRRYLSMRLVDQMMENNQKFVFRMKKHYLKRYFEQIVSGEDKNIPVTFNREETNEYRNDRSFRTKLMSTTYSLRFVKIPLVKETTGEPYDELLLTNLTQDEFSLEGIKEVYRLRWAIETAYNILKNRMKLEEFSGIRERLIRQDIYYSVWLYNLVNFCIIELNEAERIPQEQYKYEMRRNITVSIGIVKTNFIQILLEKHPERRKELMDQMESLIKKYLVPVHPNRTVKRKPPLNKSRRSYRYTY